MLENCANENTSLFNTMKHTGTDRFSIKIVEEVSDHKLEERMGYWFDRYSPEYNIGAMPEVVTRGAYKKKTRRITGIMRKKKPKGARTTNTIKCRNIETNKLKTLHGWKAACDYVNGERSNIKRAIARKSIAYGHYWWIHKKAGDTKKPVYGVNKDGHYTEVYESIAAAMRAFGEEDKGKGICTSIKWKRRWRGYLWYYRD